MPNTDTRKPHGVRYPWNRWLKPGTFRTLVRGRHYEGATHGMVSTIYQAARRRGVKVSFAVGDGSIEIIVEKGRTK